VLFRDKRLLKFLLVDDNGVDETDPGRSTMLRSNSADHSFKMILAIRSCHKIRYKEGIFR
jgi:hypothetical protein